MAKNGLFGKLLHGGDYNPEQWLEYPEILKKDIEYFKKAKINEVSLGIFSWAMLEPEEGRYQFAWMEKIIEELYENGIQVMLATPSAARPKWMADKYPEVLRVDPKGQRARFGKRHNHCYTSPVYREKVRQMNTELSRRFGRQKGVIAWHISNELEGTEYPCFCPLCQEAFRIWLKKKYGRIENLNCAWSTTFWSHCYQDFSQIEPPFENGEQSVHGLNLDWRRFVTDRVVDYVKWEIAALREAGSDLPVTINMMYNFDGLNYHKFADMIDFVSWDNYPQWHKKEEYLTAMDCGMQHDIMRSIKKEPFYLMESCPSATNWNAVSKLKKPGMMHTASLQAIAHGSDSVQYFQLRQSRGSFEKFHGAVIDHYGGDDTRVFQEVTQVGDSLERLQEVAGTATKSKVAVLYDFENRWAMEDAAGPRNCGLHYQDTVEKPYFALRKCGLNVDVIDMEQELSGYEVVVAPMLYMYRAGIAKKLRAYVKQGGKLAMTYWSGIVDETDLCFLGGTPYDMMDVFGLRSMEIDALYDGEKNTIRDLKKEGVFYECTNLCELVKISTAEVLMEYASDFYEGYPALTRNRFGKGEAYYICADLEQQFYDEFLRKLVGEAGLTSPVEVIPKGVEVTTRQSETAEYLFIQNFNRESVMVDVDLQKWSVLSGKYEDGIIDRFATVVLKRILHS